MRLSIIIPVLNSHEIVRRQALHWEKLNLPDNIEIIIVDDGRPQCSDLYIDGSNFSPDSKLVISYSEVMGEPGELDAHNEYVGVLDHLLTQCPWMGSRYSTLRVPRPPNPYLSSTMLNTHFIFDLLATCSISARTGFVIFPRFVVGHRAAIKWMWYVVSFPQIPGLRILPRPTIRLGCAVRCFQYQDTYQPPQSTD